MGPKAQHGDEFPGFSFYLIYPSLGAEEVPGNPERVTGTDKTNKQILLSLATGPGMGQSRNLATENF